MAGREVHSDALVVGAGSAGSIVAEQLSSDLSRTVTLLEAGVGLSDQRLAAQSANALALPIGAGSRLVWRYESELTGRSGQRASLVRGATLGGSGAVNGGYFCRARPADFAAGLPGWSWPEVLESFRAIETDLDFCGPQHGDSGPISVRRVHQMCSGTEQFVNAAARAGFDRIADLNDSAAPPGVGAVPLNVTAAGVRCGPGAAYLLPALVRANLTVRTQTRAVRVEIERGRAVAVHVVGPDGPKRLTADRIILCAGAIESAHLLMLSGVGEAAMLCRAGVEVVAALPVGRRFADHPEWLVAADWPGTPDRTPLEAVLHHEETEIRPYTTGFATMTGGGGHADPPQIGVALMAPRARGRLTLVSADPRVPPRIEHRYDSEPDDLAALRRGVSLVRDMLGVKGEAEGPHWSTSQHLCATAPMGADDDETAVLDTRCRVRGVDGLWVIDGSALPRVPSRGPHATIAMLAQRAVEFARA
ncbi:mycofactocin system GMC family oxidoreductase MftG [[Mycobacterium] zoologicum]|uniref:mycofactocin dehydrogenase MftG n=1 Tax=[Mycobacterium] zoologicum TaxID=2872311 RepID=UPI001CD2657A|nr:mycofactocin system GMC family oxidoreductase MftG [Mycolicibacter sp. MYC123]